jgi:GNAT superfamily N-acetyltransferase
VLLRPATAADVDVLAAMLVEAATWRPGTVRRPVAEVLALPGNAPYVQGWPRVGDGGVVAQAADEAIGAAWWRLLPADDPGYGWVDDHTPELSVGVAEPWRRQGVGTALLAAAAEAAAGSGVTQLSLSVELDNPAMRLYRRAGWHEVSRSARAATMVIELAPRAPRAL